MANTNLLKTVVEKEMIDAFSKKYSILPINLSKKQMHEIFDDMEPDLIGYHIQEKALYLGEITTSGYMGQKNRDYHVGAVKKVFEAFSRFYLFHDDFLNIIQRAKKANIGIEIESLKCFFIVPEGSRFIKALGYREKLFKTGHMSLETISLTEEAHSIMLQVLKKSKDEMKL